MDISFVLEEKSFEDWFKDRHCENCEACWTDQKTGAGVCPVDWDFTAPQCEYSFEFKRYKRILEDAGKELEREVA